MRIGSFNDAVEVVCDHCLLVRWGAGHTTVVFNKEELPSVIKVLLLCGSEDLYVYYWNKNGWLRDYVLQYKIEALCL